MSIDLVSYPKILVLSRLQRTIDIMLALVEDCYPTPTVVTAHETLHRSGPTPKQLLVANQSQEI
jgi:hypothetical protein